MTVGERLKDLRGQKGWSLDYLAQLSGVSKTYIWEIEKGNVVDATIGIGVAWKLATAFDVPLSFMVPRGQEPPPSRPYDLRSNLARIRENLKEARRFVRSQPYYVESVLDAADLDLLVAMGRPDDEEPPCPTT